MFWTKINVSTRTVILSTAVVCLAAAGLIIGAQFDTAAASTAIAAANTSVAAPAAVFPGTGVGPIPDGLAGTPPQFGAPLVVSYTVAGIAGPISNIDVSMTLTHTWVGDVDVILRAPGGTPSMVIVSRIGVTTATSFGSSSDYGGTYLFDDSAAGTNIWTAAAATPVPPGSYRTTAPGQAAQTNPAPVTNMLATFGAMTPAQINGTWTLSFRDAANLDTGSVTASSLTIDSATVAPDAPVDFTGDGKSDYVIVRNTGGGPLGQITWVYSPGGGGPPSSFQWGLATDFFLAEDFDGDLKDDITVWRPGAATVAAFYILNSNGFTARVEPFGQTGDDSSVIGDYNNDGKADLAVYRGGAVAGAQSFWYYRTTPNGPVTYVPWGQNGDFPAPGDYDGDGKNDFVIQRNNGGGQARFWMSQTTAGFSTVVFGTPTDVIVPGDYDGDGKTDIATLRGSGGAILWFYDPSSIPGTQVVQATWGVSATDFPTQGDYDGDGKTDLAVWRPSPTAGSSAFYVVGSTSGTFVVPFGQNADYPVANYNSH